MHQKLFLYAGAIIAVILLILDLLVYLKVLPNPLLPILSPGIPASSGQPSVLDPNDPTARQYLSRFFPYDPESKMVKRLELTYTLFGVVNKVEKVSDENYRMTMTGTENDIGSFVVDVSLKDKPRITDSQRKTIAPDQIKPTYTATINLVVDKKTGTQRVLNISVNQ